MLHALLRGFRFALKGRKLGVDYPRVLTQARIYSCGTSDDLPMSSLMPPALQRSHSARLLYMPRPRRSNVRLRSIITSSTPGMTVNANGCNATGPSFECRSIRNGHIFLYMSKACPWAPCTSCGSSNGLSVLASRDARYDFFTTSPQKSS